MEKELVAGRKLAAFFSSVLPTQKKVKNEVYDKVERAINVNSTTGIVEVCVRRKGENIMQVGYGSTVAEATKDAINRLIEREGESEELSKQNKRIS